MEPQHPSQEPLLPTERELTPTELPPGVDRRSFMMRSAVLGSAVVIAGAPLSQAQQAAAAPLPPYVLGILAGVASGAAMLPYTVIKEANPPELSGTATGAINFLNFTFSAVLGPAFGWLLRTVSGGAGTMSLDHYQMAFEPLLYGVGLAVLLTLALKETGAAARRTEGAR